jgi:hypothetical protein
MVDKLVSVDTADPNLYSKLSKLGQEISDKVAPEFTTGPMVHGISNAQLYGTSRSRSRSPQRVSVSSRSRSPQRVGNYSGQRVGGSSRSRSPQRVGNYSGQRVGMKNMGQQSSVYYDPKVDRCRKGGKFAKCPM